ncbi:MAG: hypothetical protein R6T96_02485 [Longimicrobiales bacterium]
MVAPLITMFYLITYAMINAVVLIEQSMGLVSFRPLLRIPRWVSAAGLFASLFAMFVVHPIFSEGPISGAPSGLEARWFSISTKMEKPMAK